MDLDDELFRMYNKDVAPLVEHKSGCNIKVVYTGGIPDFQYHIYKHGELLYSGYSYQLCYKKAMNNAKAMIRTKGF